MAPVARVVSGGQTGVDRAALDWAIRHGIPHGGWCPRGRKAEDGRLDPVYLLQETESAGYRQRTRQNVIDSDGTLILNLGELDGGTRRTVALAHALGRPHLLLQVDDGLAAESVPRLLEWLSRESVAVLNIAGPRESKRPGAYWFASMLLDWLVGRGKAVGE